MVLSLDQDIKIAGDKPSRDVEINRRKAETVNAPDQDSACAAKELGKEIAQSFMDDDRMNSADTRTDNTELLLQRRLLLSFTATVGFEQFCKDDSLAGIAQKSFLDTLKTDDPELYRSASDTGAFSFYYLAYRRGNETERRIGQTFAMLCSHDGDPILQELGEAIFCWFTSTVKTCAEKLKLS